MWYFLTNRTHLVFQARQVLKRIPSLQMLNGKMQGGGDINCQPLRWLAFTNTFTPLPSGYINVYSLLREMGLTALLQRTLGLQDMVRKCVRCFLQVRVSDPDFTKCPHHCYFFVQLCQSLQGERLALWEIFFFIQSLHHYPCQFTKHLPNGFLGIWNMPDHIVHAFRFSSAQKDAYTGGSEQMAQLQTQMGFPLIARP